MQLKIHPLVFSYGTLKRGFHNHSMMQQAGAEFVCRGATLECYPLVVEGLPFLLASPGKGYHVEGEIFRINSAEGWSYLDELNWHPYYYERRLTDIVGEDGEIYSAWVYFLIKPEPRVALLPLVRAYRLEDGAMPPQQD